MKYKSFCLENSVPCPVSEMSSIQAAPKREEDLVMQLSHRLHPRSSVPSSGIWEWRAGTECTFLLKDQPWCPERGCGFPAFHPVCFPVHIVPSKSLESTFGTNTEGLERVVYHSAKGLQTQVLPQVFCALFSHGGHATGPGRHWSCGQRGTWNSAQRDQRNFPNEALLYWKQSSRLFQPGPWLVSSKGPILIHQ